MPRGEVWADEAPRVKGYDAPVQVHRCKSCGEEYRVEAGLTACADCGGALTVVDDEAVPYAPRDPESPAPEEEVSRGTRVPPEGYVPVHVTRDYRDIGGFVERLEAAGLAFHVQDVPGERGYSASTFSVMVPQDDLLAARRAVAPLLGMDPADVEREFDPEQGYGQCPACSASIPAGAEACPECGLTIASDEEP
jgi:hypothetical protein